MQAKEKKSFYKHILKVKQINGNVTVFSLMPVNYDTYAGYCNKNSI